MMTPIKDMKEPELRKYFTWLAKKIETDLPPGPNPRGKCLFFLVVCDTCEDGVGQYVGNMEREGAIKLLRETADRMEKNEDITR